MTETADIPLVIAGPILRRITPSSLTFWLAVSAPVALKVSLFPAARAAQHYQLDRRDSDQSNSFICLTAAPKLHYLLVSLELEHPLPQDQWIDYQLELKLEDDREQGWQAITELVSDLCYPERTMPGFFLPSQVGALLHGSCRKPHHQGTDGLLEADRFLAANISHPHCARSAKGEPLSETANSAQQQTWQNQSSWPALLMMSGDQIYADDVAGPMLRNIHSLLQTLQLPKERLQNSEIPQVNDSDDLYSHPDSYYNRELLLPNVEKNASLLEMLFAGSRKPIFTSDSAHNHLITLGEYLAMYLMVWSPTPWQIAKPEMPAQLSESQQQNYLQEQATLETFLTGLSAVRRVMAHLPVAMIFDDHDVTDDWNLNREWEEAVYDHPLSRRIVGNGLIAYLINQGWGNRPEAFSSELISEVQEALSAPGNEQHEALIEQIFEFAGWDFDWPTEPPLVVLDTRTRRWRSESSAHKPSGLIDWEALTDLQRRLSGHNAVLLVSAAPIFGVKLIEVIQRLFTFFGKPLLVDAENWMAHPGTSNGILNVFRHRKTPQNFVVLSGDVHYSFVYDVELRGRSHGPDIWQICSSGLCNSFPEKLLDKLDRLNRWLYHPRSPLNWFTSRRKMRIIPRKPQGIPSGRRLLNHTGIGLVELDQQGRPWRIRQLLTNGKDIIFERREEESNWH